MSGLHLSLKSLPGVFEGRDFPDGAGDGVRVVKISLESFTETFIKIQHQEHCQDFTYPTSLFLESCRTGIFLIKTPLVLVLGGAGDGVTVFKISQGSFTESFIKIQH